VSRACSYTQIYHCCLCLSLEHWPCEEGCNLCGDNGYMTNGKNNFSYTSVFLDSATTFRCYDVMYSALVGGLSGTSYCDSLPPLAAEPCGCEGGSSGFPDESPADPQLSTPPTDQPGSSSGNGADDQAEPGIPSHSPSAGATDLLITKIIQSVGLMASVLYPFIG
jgi:hypothetical protein